MAEGVAFDGKGKELAYRKREEEKSGRHITVRAKRGDLFNAKSKFRPSRGKGRVTRSLGG